MEEELSCDFCGEPGEIKSILFFTGCYCQACYDKEIEKLQDERDAEEDYWNEDYDG